MMVKALFSIKPKYAQKILSGQKKFELRRLPCKKEISSIIIYETSPTCLVVGEVKVARLIKQKPEDLWQIVKDSSFVTYESYKKYFANHEYAYAYELKEPMEYKIKKTLTQYGVKSAPQNFIYLD